eukprot:scaffold23510_cov115-Cylindrotheca_fusiformis.AAC.4
MAHILGTLKIPTMTNSIENPFTSADSYGDGWVAFDSDIAKGFFAEVASSTSSTVATSVTSAAEVAPNTRRSHRTQRGKEARIKPVQGNPREHGKEARPKTQVHHVARSQEQEQARRKAREEQFRIIAEEERLKLLAKEQARRKTENDKAKRESAAEKARKVKVQEIAIVEHFDDEEQSTYVEEGKDLLAKEKLSPVEQQCREVDLDEFEQIVKPGDPVASAPNEADIPPHQEEHGLQEQHEESRLEKKVPKGSPKKNKKGWFRSSKSRKPKQRKDSKSVTSSVSVGSSKTTEAEEEERETLVVQKMNSPETKAYLKTKTSGKSQKKDVVVVSDDESSFDSDMDTLQFLKEFDRREGNSYDDVIQKIGRFVCGSSCLPDENEILYEEGSMCSSPPRKKSREFDTIAPRSTTRGSPSPAMKKGDRVMANDSRENNQEGACDSRRMRSAFDDEDDDKSEFSETDGESDYGSEFTGSTGRLSSANGMIF